MITKAIVGLSYDDSGTLDDVINETISQAEKEKEKSDVVNHYFLRSKDNPYSLKSNFLVYDILISAWTMMNYYKSSLEKIAFPSDKRTEEIFNHFVDYYNVNKDSERFVFADEGNDLSFKNTLLKGKEKLGVSDDETILLGTGDLIHAFDIDSIIKDPDTEKYEVVWDFNAFSNIYPENKSFNEKSCPYNRRWHLPIREKGGIFQYALEKLHLKKKNFKWVKESNLLSVKLNKTFLDLIGSLFSVRKTHNSKDQEPVKYSVLKKIYKVVKERNIEDNLSGRPQLIYKLAKKDWNGLKALTKAPNVALYILIRYSTKYNPAIINYKQLNKFISILSGIGLKFKSDHNDFGRLGDVDSIEDLVFNEELMRTPKEVSDIHPHVNELKGFMAYLHSVNFKGIEQSKDYINKLIEHLPLLKGKKLYDEKGNYLFPEIFSKQKEKINVVLKQRKEFLQRWKENKQQESVFYSDHQHL